MLPSGAIFELKIYQIAFARAAGPVFAELNYVTALPGPDFLS